MPLSKNVASYPANFRTLAEGLGKLRGEEVITFRTHGEAVKTRQQLYGFAGALEHFVQSAPDHPFAEKYQAMCDAIRGVEIRLRGDRLIFVSRFDTSSYQAIDELISRLNEAPEPTFETIRGTPEDYMKGEEKTKQELDHDNTLRKLGYITDLPTKQCTKEEMKQEAPPLDLNELMEGQASHNTRYQEIMAMATEARQEEVNRALTDLEQIRTEPKPDTDPPK